MRVTREQAAENRERIVQAAAKLFRERGFDGIGVADLMKSAGLTHGGFYGHFRSKDDLAAEACARALEKSVEKWDRLATESPGDPLGAIAGSYLSQTHIDKPGSGCLIAALGPDVARQGKSVRRTMTEGLRTMMERLTGWVPGKSKAERRRSAIASYAAMVGAMVMARGVDDPDLADEILRTVLASLPLKAH
ncbi:MAG TPA: TetR/AcrR family transcriptional regulator [Dongiaceae bacterium]|nr:TetR/AcrR family transcriptional regulator [Dongiaceae bacterium]